MVLEPLSAKQAWSIRESNARINLWDGSVRSGKTIASLIRWAKFVRDWPGHGDLVMVGKTSRTLERNALGPLAEMFGSDAVRYTAGAAEARIFGRKVYRIGANDERAEQKIRGGTFGGLYGDEVTLWPESFWRMGLSRLSVHGAMLFGTTNADAPMHWLKVGFIDRVNELDMRLFHFTIDDNAALDPAFVASLKLEYTGLWYKRFIDGLWVAAEGMIWDGFDADKHVVDAIPDDTTIVRWFASYDYGTSNPFSALLFGVDDKSRYWVADEWRWDSKIRGHQLTDSQYREKLAAWLQGHGVTVAAIWGDPSAASFQVECRQHALPSMAADNEVEDGLRDVATAFAQDRIRILRKCSGLIGEIPSYSWDPRQQAKGIDAPLKVADHSCDALRYGVRSDALGHYDLADYGWV